MHAPFLTKLRIISAPYGSKNMVHHEMSCNKIVEAMQKMKSGKATEPFEVNLEMIGAGDEIGVKVMMVVCQCVLDGRKCLMSG